MSGREKELKNWLNGYKGKPHTKEALENTLCAVKNEKVHKQYEPMTNMEFYLSQAAFIRKRVWLIQTILVAVFVWFTRHMALWNPNNHNVFVLTSILAPLLILINLSENNRLLRHNLLEIEMAAKISFQKVLMARLSIFGTVDFILMFFMTIMASPMFSRNIGMIALYCLVPFNLMCIGCFYIMRKGTTEGSLYYCTVYGTILMTLFLVGTNEWIGIYKNQYEITWIAVFILTAIILVYQIRRFNNGTEYLSFEETV